jgi:hypothetical protein
MTWLAIAFLSSSLLVLLYVFWLRAMLRCRPRYQPFYDWLEPIEARLCDKSRTILVARLYQLAGILATVQAALQESGIDWLSLVPIPDEYAKYVGPTIWVTGILFAKLRKITSAPLEQRE